MKKKKKLIYSSIFMFILSAVFTFVACMLLSPRIYIEEQDFSVFVNHDFKKPKYQAYAMNKDISPRVKVIGKINTNKVGTYQLTYEVDYFIFHAKEARIVKVIDQEKPTLTLYGSQEVSLCPNETYQEEGYLAIDNYDGDITSQVKLIQGKDKITYQITDASGNTTEKKRFIHRIDTTSPSISLNGPQFLNLTLGSSYIESGAKANDHCDGDLTKEITTTGEVDTSKEGTYVITYSVKDKSGNEASIMRTIRVTNTTPKQNNGIIYLTFDDGPSSTITGKILDILKEENIKATFFVIHHDQSLHNLIKREFQEGHTVALHSYTHNYANVYQSKDAYFADLAKIQEEVYQITGQKSQIIRFPGGSSNTISKRYCPKIMSNLTSEVISKGYHYFDWNVSSGDAGGVHSSTEVYQNVTSNLSLNRANVVLMHDFENNYHTLNALRDIIHYGKNNGYSFQAITMDTPMVKHKVAN